MLYHWYQYVVIVAVSRRRRSADITASTSTSHPDAAADPSQCGRVRRQPVPVEGRRRQAERRALGPSSGPRAATPGGVAQLRAGTVVMELVTVYE